MSLVDAALRLRTDCDALRFSGVEYVYQPLDYAWAPHEAYCGRFGASRKRVVLVGMNPGPHGMGQTGVPFGDVVWVRDWMGIERPVAQPRRMHPKRPITGFATTRREASGNRLYGWASVRFGAAKDFFADFFVVNYCPLLFFDAEGKNLTPPQLRKADVAPLHAACDEHLARVVGELRPKLLVGVGGFAEERCRIAADARQLPVRVGGILHPSPASPAANRGWVEQAERQLMALGALRPPTR